MSTKLFANKQWLSCYDDLLFISKTIYDNKKFKQSIKIFSFYLIFTIATHPKFFSLSQLSLNSRGRYNQNKEKMQSFIQNKTNQTKPKKKKKKHVECRSNSYAN